MAKSLTARFNLGMAYYNGDGVPQDAVKASQWLKLAVRQNFSEAKYSLGLLLIEGEGGIRKTPTKGFPCCVKHPLKIISLPANIFEKERGSIQPLRKQVPTRVPRFFQFFQDRRRGARRSQGVLHGCRFSSGLRPGLRAVFTLGQRRESCCRSFCRAYGVNGKRNEKRPGRGQAVVKCFGTKRR